MIIVAAVLAADPAAAQSSGNASSTVMWGTVSPGLGSGGLDGANTHVANGTSAAQVQAAKDGFLLPANISITAVGVQNIVSVTGDNNNIAATQTGLNAGDVSNNGTVRGN